MEKKAGDLMNYFWLALAASAPLFCIPLARVNLGIYHLPLPAFLIAILFGVIFMNGPLLRTGLKSSGPYRTLLILTLLVLITHGISMLQGDPFDYALREFLKIGSGIICFWVIILFFPNDPQFLRLFFKFIAGTTFILLAALLYQYAVVFKAPYLGTIFSEEAFDGRNHLAWFLTALLPYFLISLFEKRVSLFWLIVNAVACLSVIYTLSRSSWIAVMLIMGYFGFFSFRDRLRLNLKMLFLLAAIITLSLGLLIHSANLAETFKTRLQSIYDPESLPETQETSRFGKHSKGMRTGLILDGLSEFRKNPWLGHALANSYSDPPIDREGLTHNDYVGLLAETGLMGALPFFVFLIVLAGQMMPRRKAMENPFLLRAAQASFLAILFLSNFINIYTSLHYWFFLALALKATQVSQRAMKPCVDEIL